MSVKRSFKQILMLMAGRRSTKCLSLLLTVIMALQLAVVPASAGLWQGEEGTSTEVEEGTGAEGSAAVESVPQTTAPTLKNTYALVTATGGQPGDAIEYFKVIYEDSAGIRRVEYILREESKSSFDQAQKYGNGNARREKTNSRIYFWIDDQKTLSDPTDAKPLQTEQRDTFLFETVYDVKRIVGLEIMHNAGQWDCQGLWLYEVDQIYGEEMYGYVSDESYISFSGWRLAELEMKSRNGQITYTTLQNSRPKLYRMGENGQPEYNLIIYDRSEAKYDTTEGREFAMRIDIADVYCAGFENSLWSTGGDGTIGNNKYQEELKVEIRYLDSFGCVQTISAHAMASSLIWALDNGVPESTKLTGFGLQGDTLLFPVSLPYFADLLDVRLRYDTKVYVGDDGISLTSISMYDLTLSMADVTVDPARAAIVPSISYNPVYLWTTTNRRGYVMSPSKEKVSFKLRLNEQGVGIVDEPIEDEYLVEVITDSMPSAATTSDLSLILTYETFSGAEQRTEKIMLREQSKDFHGYTPGADSDNYLVDAANVYYWLGMRPGGKLHLRIKIPNVSQFTGATFALENGGSDEWQMGGLNIYRLKEVSKREVTWGEFVVGGIRCHRYYDRSFKGDLVFSGARSMLVQQGAPAELEIGDGGANSSTILPDPTVAWEDVKYSMSYEESLQNIGFTETRNTYQVEVTVAGNSALAGAEDAGSKNQFYFQLIFQNGASGYVLANQQLSGDGFRAGYTETFTIKTNQDYGELSSVRIIPEDTSSKSDTFDKLHIDSIQVVRRSEGGLSRQWSLDRVGWIDIDYRDEGAANGMLGQSGRTEEEMSRSFNVTYSTYAVNLLVSITTLASPFSGTVYGDICYYNSAGETKHKSFDIVQLMYEYANKTPRYNSTVSATGSVSTGSSAWSDSFMFRAGGTDRFIITLSDARELAYMDISAYMAGLSQGEGGTWHIGGVAVSLIESEGSLLINMNDEYERDNKVSLLTTNVQTNRNPAYQLLLEHNALTTQRIQFMENKINLDTNFGSVNVLSREPVSQNDVLNIFVYPNLEKSDPSTEYTLKAAATYTSPRGMQQASAGTLNLSADGTVFYMVGVKATGMTVLNDLTIQADNPVNIPNAYIDRAIVQQVRSGVIINTYEIDYNAATAAYGLRNAPNAESEESYVDEQVVMLSIGEGIIEPLMLQPETKDLAVALKYIPEHSAPDSYQDYDSSFIFLTDQQISMLRSGQTVSLTFQEKYVKEITGVVAVATGDMSVPIDMACVGTYRVAKASGERVERNWYSFSEFVDGMYGTEVTRVDRWLGYTGYSVKPLKLQFVTAPATTDSESGVNGAVEMTISYVDDYGTVRTKTIPDLRIYATTPTPFATDTVTDVELLVEGMREVRWVEVRPYDDRGDTDIGWRLSSAGVQLGLNSEMQKRTVDDTKMIYESDGRKINFSTVSVMVNVQAESNTGSPTNIDVVNETVSILLDSGQSAQLKVDITGSEEGYTVKAERASDLQGTATADASNFLSESGRTLIFEPGNNYTGAKIYYRITVTSVEVGTKSVIILVQDFEPEPEKETDLDELLAALGGSGGGSNSGGSSGDSGGSGGDTGGSGSSDGSDGGSDGGGSGG